MIAGAVTASQIQIHMTRCHDEKLRFALFRHRRRSGSGLLRAQCRLAALRGINRQDEPLACTTCESAHAAMFNDVPFVFCLAGTKVTLRLFPETDSLSERYQPSCLVLTMASKTFWSPQIFLNFQVLHWGRLSGCRVRPVPESLSQTRLRISACLSTGGRTKEN